MVLPIVKCFYSSLLFVVVIEHNFKLLQMLTTDMSVLIRKVEEVLSMNSLNMVKNHKLDMTCNKFLV
jgi:hypothetical protein